MLQATCVLLQYQDVQEMHSGPKRLDENDCIRSVDVEQVKATGV